MPLEIRELVIKATVQPQGSNAQGNSPQASGNSSGSSQAELVNLCVEKVLEIIRAKTER
ncbi:MAG: DUF5908 family protein [Bacteroidota bacterium]